MTIIVKDVRKEVPMHTGGSVNCHKPPEKELDNT